MVNAVLPREGYRGEFPALGRSYRSDGESIPYLAETRRWFETWARSPMACEFVATDWERLRMLARVVDGFYRDPKASLLAEIRLQEALLGGSPLDRRRLGMQIAPAEAPAEAAQVVAIEAYRQELGA